MAKYTDAQRQQAVTQLKAGESVTNVANTLGVSRPTVYRWSKSFGDNKTEFNDGITNVYSSLPQERSGLGQNIFTADPIRHPELRQIYKTGLSNKICRLKSSHALNDALLFESEEKEKYYNQNLNDTVRKAVQFMIAFGRSIIVLYEPGDDLSKPLHLEPDLDSLQTFVFSGDLISVGMWGNTFGQPRYYEPIEYIISANGLGANVHYSRVIDFQYVQPTLLDKPMYQFGGISEFELIYQEIMADAITARAASTIIEKNSSMVYKITGLDSKMQSKQDSAVIKYFQNIETARSIYGAILLDSQDDVTAVNQSLSNLKEVAEHSLRRVAMVTDIPVAMLVGEAVQGLNSTGDNEMKSFQQAIFNLQHNYIYKPLNQLAKIFNIGPIEFKEGQGQTPLELISYEKAAIDNAFKLFEMGEDYRTYLEEKDVVQPKTWDEFWTQEAENENMLAAPDQDADFEELENG